MGIDHSGLANRYYSFRYAKLISGRTDLPNRAHRIEAFSKALRRKSTRRKKIPFSINLLSWMYNLRMNTESMVNLRSGYDTCVRRAIPIGFFFRMGVSEVHRIRKIDSSFFREDDKRHLTVSPLNPRTHKEGYGFLEPWMRRRALSPMFTV